MRLRTGLFLVLVAGSALLGSGCTALLIGGAAAGGYAIGKDERPVGQIVDDGTLTASIKSKFIADKYVPASSIDVDTFEGKVTLNGKVRTYVARSQAEKLARETKGVREVINNLEVVEQ